MSKPKQLKLDLSSDKDYEASRIKNIKITYLNLLKEKELEMAEFEAKDSREAVSLSEISDYYETTYSRNRIVEKLYRLEKS